MHKNPIKSIFIGLYWLVMYKEMVPPHGTVPRRKTYIIQYLASVKFDFVAHISFRNVAQYVIYPKMNC